MKNKTNCKSCKKEFSFSAIKYRNIKYCYDCRIFLKNLSGRDWSRELVRIKFNHTCNKCGKKWLKNKRRFDIHHLNGICGKKSRGYDNIDDLKILVCLCHQCHLSLHEVRKKMSKPKTKKVINS